MSCLSGILFLLSAQGASAQAKGAIDPQKAAGADRTQSWLTWTAPPVCPRSVDIEKRFEDWLKTPWQEDKELKVEASAQSRDGLWLVILNFKYGDASGKREVELQTCNEAADFVALTVALAVDPDLVVDGESTESASDDSAKALVPPPPLPPPLEVEPNPLVESEEEATGEGGQEPGEFAVDEQLFGPVTTPPSDRKKISGPKAEPSATAQAKTEPLPPPADWFLSAAIQGQSGVLPRFAVGPKVAGGVRHGSWLLSVGVFYLPGGSYSFENWSSDARMRLVSAEAQGCFLFRVNWLSGGPCVGTQLGALPAEERPLDPALSPLGGTAFWWAALLGGQGAVDLSERWGLYADAQLAIPLVRPSFQLSGGTEVFRSNLGVSGIFGVRFFF